ncbi:DUF4340 domain-containing protein [bacterium D16-54]|nr:DUF4340 domain-containing protein [bacterium D16-54]RKJ14699.1 DUF4340 domain-containing protein [bacterium D16-56]
MKRNRKLAVLVILLVCISLAAFGVNKYEEQKEVIKNSDEIILEVAGDKVNTGSFGFHRNDEGKWLYDEDEAFPVDEEKIGALLGLFEEFGVSFIIEEVEDFGQYGLDTPVCTIRMETKEKNYEIRLGNFSAMDSERYVSIGDGNAYLVKKDPLEQFEIEISDMIKHDEIPELEKVTGISFSGGEPERKEPERIIYEEDSTDSYLKEDVYFMEQGELDTARVKNYLDAIRNLDLKDYINYKVSENDLASYGLDAPELSITVDYTVTEEGTDEEKTESFVLNIARDPKERAEEEKKAEKRENQEKTDEESEEKEITAYVRAEESRIVYQLSTEEYESLMDRSYDSLRHQEMFWADFKDVSELEILLEGNTYTITSDKKGDERVYRYLDEELDLADIRSAIKGLRAETFTDETPDGKEEISLTIRMDNDNYPETTIQLYRYNGEACIAVVDREPVAFVTRASVVDLVEAVNGVVLK